MSKQLFQQSVHGAWWSALGSTGLNITQVIFTVIFARFLQPYDFGVMAVVLLVASVVRGLFWTGFAAPIIRQKEPDEELMSNIFWLAGITGILLAMIMFGVTHMLILVYGDTSMLAALRIASVACGVIGIGTVPYALLQREMRMNERSRAMVTGMIIGGMFAVASIPIFGDVRSLLTQHIMYFVVSTALFWRYAKWTPLRVWSPKKLRAAWPVISLETGNFMLQFGSNRLDQLLVATVLGPIALGYYDVAFRIHQSAFAIVLVTVNDIAFPLFAKLKGDLETMRHALLKTTVLLHATTIPLAVGFLMYAPQIVQIFFGETWLPTVPIIRIFSVLGVAKSVTVLCNRVLIGTGKLRINILMEFIKVLAIALGVGAVVSHGIVPVALMLTGVFVIMAMAYVRVIHTVIRLPLGNYAQSLVPLLLAGLAMSTVPYLLLPTIGTSDGYVLHWFLHMTISGLTYIAVVHTLDPRYLRIFQSIYHK